MLIRAFDCGLLNFSPRKKIDGVYFNFILKSLQEIPENGADIGHFNPVHQVNALYGENYILCSKPKVSNFSRARAYEIEYSNGKGRFVKLSLSWGPWH